MYEFKGQKVFYDGEFFGTDLTDKQFERLSADDLRDAIMNDCRWVVRAPNGRYVRLGRGGLICRNTEDPCYEIRPTSL
jgi:hypothetical protein